MKPNYISKSRTAAILKLFLIACFTLVFGVERSSASHAAGADISYHYLGGNNYVLTFTLYRDCLGIPAPTSVTVNVTSLACSQNLTFTLNEVTGTGQEITRPCSTATTHCNGGSEVGIQKYVYEAQVTLPMQCNDWVLGVAISARNAAITTLSGASGYNLYVEARLNNVTVTNDNSPMFSVDPIVFVCVGQAFTYNQGAIDPDGDSLVYSSIAPRTDANTNVPYNSPYNPFNPLSSAPPVTVNSVTGDIVMHATVAGEVAVMAVLVQEYRNGVLIGSVVRDIQIYTVTCNNQLPTASGINGTTSYALIQCAGSTVHFTINSADLDAGQTVTMTWNNGIPAPATFTSTTASRPVGTFNWVTTAADARSQPYTFTVTVRDNNCPSTGAQVYSYSVTIHSLVVTATSTAVACNGGATGSATATASGTGGPYTYVWSPGGVAGQTRSNMAAGTYTVVATDAGGCNSSTTVVVTQPAALVVTATTSPQTCSGLGSAVITVTGGTAPYTYSVNTNPVQTTSTITNLVAGTYVETVRDAHGCRTTYNIVIANGGGQLSATQTHTNVLCNGALTGTAAVTVTGGSGSYTYAWSPSGGSAATATGLAAGTYTVTITSGVCTTTQTIIITQPPALTATQTHTNVLCNGGSTGTGSVTASGGTGTYTYLWSPSGGTGASATGLAANTYTVTIRDANQCSTTQTIVITQPAAITATQTHTNVLCNGGSTGSASVTAAGGTGAYSYTWNPNVSTTSSASNIAAGSYTVTIRDANGCTTTQTIVVTQPAVLAATQTHTNVLCNGGSTGSASVTATGGTGAYTYTWSPNVSTTATANNIAAGTYSVTIRDANGCSISQSIVVTQPNAIVSSQVHSNVTCAGAHNGTASVAAVGGTGAYTYTWSPNVSTTSSASGLNGGTYTVTVRDANGCTSVQTIVVTEPTPFALTFSWTGEHCSVVDASVGVVVTGGTGPYTYSWTGWPEATPGGTTATIYNQEEDTFRVVVTDANGCTTSGTVYVPSINAVPPQPGVITGPTVVCTGVTYAYSITPMYQAQSYTWAAPAGATIVTGQGTSAVTIRFATASGNVSVTPVNCVGNGTVRTLAVTRNCREAGEVESERAFDVYPNPANDKVNVSINGADKQEIRVELSDLLGKSVYVNTEKSGLNYLNTIDISNLSSGIYMLKVQYMDVVKMVKVVKD